MFSVLTALYVHYKFEETLPEEKRKEIDTKALNPFAFRELWKGRAMSLMCLAILFQGITVDMHDVKMGWSLLKLAAMCASLQPPSLCCSHLCALKQCCSRPSLASIQT